MSSSATGSHEQDRPSAGGPGHGSDRTDRHSPSEGTPEEPAPLTREDVSPRRGAGSQAGAEPSAEIRKGTTFSRDVFQFLTGFAQSVQKHSMYPPGHPALEPSVDGVADSLLPLLQDRAILSIGIGNTQLTVEGSESDPEHPRFGFLARRLHRHQLVSVTFMGGVDREEIAGFVAAVAVEADMAEEPLGTRVEREGSPWEHIRIQPIRYQQLGLAGRDSGAGDGQEEGRASRLWLGLARAALMTEAVGGDLRLVAAAGLDTLGPSTGGFDEGAMARAVEEYSSEPEYARDVLNHLTTLSQELKGASGGEAAELKRRLSRLIALVKPEALRQVLKEAGDSGTRRQLLLDASQWMEPQSVVKLVRATAGVEKQDISHFLLLMMSKLAQHASSGAPEERAEAEQTLKEQVEQLVEGWSLDDAVPITYGEALERMSQSIAAPDPKTDTVVEVEPERVLQMSMEIDVVGPTVWAAVGELFDAGRFGTLVDILENAPPGTENATQLWTRFASPEAVRRILEEAEPDFDTLDHLTDFLGIAAVEPMLQVLANSESRAVRRQLFSRLAAIGPEIAPLVLRFLEDARWFVKRNMLALLGEIEDCPVDWSPEPYADHSHPAVRREALKIMLRLPAHRDRAVCGLLQDTDPRALALGLGAAQESAPSAATPRLLQLALNRGLNEELRVMAIRALARLAPPEAVAPLLELVYRKRTWLGRLLPGRRLAEPAPLMLEALRALGSAWPDDPRVRRLVSRAARSSDPLIREAGKGRQAT